MKHISFAGREVPAVIVGCMRLNAVDAAGQRRLISAAIERGLTFFDHADIYGRGECETAFGNAAADLKIPREKLFVQTKCGIVPGKMYDFSEKHIIESVEGSLKRLRTDYVDSLLLHRPDVLFEPEEVAAAFDKLERAGKVRAFGVSNMAPCQIDLLKTAVKQPIAANQLQFSAAHAGMISCNVELNMTTPGAVARDGYVLEYCRLHDIAVQAWSPFRYGFFEGVFLDDAKYRYKLRREQGGRGGGVDTAAPRQNAGDHGHGEPRAPFRHRGGRRHPPLARRMVQNLHRGRLYAAVESGMPANRQLSAA